MSLFTETVRVTTVVDVNLEAFMSKIVEISPVWVDQMGDPSYTGTRIYDLRVSAGGPHCDTCQCRGRVAWSGYSFLPKDEAEADLMRTMTQEERFHFVKQNATQIKHWQSYQDELKRNRT